MATGPGDPAKPAVYWDGFTAAALQAAELMGGEPHTTSAPAITAP